MDCEAEIVDPQDLTPREAEILCLVCDGLTNKSIARKLAISINTTIHHIDHIRHKLGVEQNELNARVRLLRVALARGIVKHGCAVLTVGMLANSDDPALAARVRLLRPGVSRRAD